MARKCSCCRELAFLLDPAPFRVLGDPSRIELLLRLANAPAPRTVTELAAGLPLDLSVISRHLHRLRDAGTVRSVKRGKAVFYSLDCGELARHLRRLADALDACCPVDEPETEASK